MIHIDKATASPAGWWCGAPERGVAAEKMLA